MKYGGRLLAGVVLFCACAITTSEAGQSVGGKLPIFVDHAAPPAQIGQLAAQSDAVIAVRIESVRFESITDPRSGRPEDVTRYDVRVLDVMKAHGSLPPPLGAFTLTRRGGQHTENGRVVASAEQGFEEFAQNGEYVLFLTWNNRRNAFDIAYGPDGSFQVMPNGRVRPLGHSTMAKTHEGKTRQAFLQELRGAAGR